MDHRKTNLNFGLLFSIKAVDGGYTDWSESKCSVTCGGGVKTLTRSCTNPPASDGGKDCSQLGRAKKTVPCNEQKCCKFFLVAIFCASLFIRFSPIMLAEASIHVLQSSEKWPFSFSKGWSFFSHYTAVDGGYTDWSESKCSVTCGGGVRTLTRTCTNPPPSNGGKDCSELGPAEKTVPCNEQKCRKYSFHNFLP